MAPLEERGVCRTPNVEPMSKRSSVERGARHPVVAKGWLAGALACLGACGPDGTGAAGVAEGELVADATTLDRKLIVGYQGWFSTPRSGRLGWSHWAPGRTPSRDNVTFDLWPDLSELDADELAETDLRFAGGGRASLFSSYSAKTVLRHFAWMQAYGIDGVLLQRFVSELGSGPHKDHRDTVTENVMRGSERYGRTFAIEYDVSGANQATLVEDLTRDWVHLDGDLGVTASDRYIRHRGRPVVAIWGLGFSDRPGTVDQAHRIIDFFQGRATLIGGVPLDWATGANMKPGFLDVYRRFDIVNPWSVGGYRTDADVEWHRQSRVERDLAQVRGWGREYMPVLFPGFSWTNLTRGRDPLNMYPRRGGAFYWKQFYELQSAGCTMMFGAMFDEVDEGTAIFKVASRRGDAPEGDFLTLDADGHTLPSDWYLRLAGEGAKMLRGEIPLSREMPISPGTPPGPPPPPPSGREEIVVAHAYRGILGREPDPGGLSSWSANLRGGMPLDAFCAALFSSDEFRANRGSLSPEALAADLYRGMLERAPDPSGLDATAQAIRDGNGPRRAREILESDEFRQRFLL
jgi:hypothetical protein